MNASQIITEDMTLEEKLSAIDAALKAAQAVAADDQAKDVARSGKQGQAKVAAPIDPALLTMCDSCQ